jgi:rSAM/selenodomain-associated transferase 1
MKNSESVMQSGFTQRRVLLFIRAPELGRVKTRLEKKMDAATVLTLYRHFVEDTLERLTAGGYDIIVFFSPLHKEPVIRVWLGDTAHLQPQTGKTLGEKMRNAFSTVFSMDVGQAVLMGSDFPDLDMRIIDEAFAFLQKKDVVIGPAEDGGYYLIGFRKDAFDGDVFADIDWGTDHVCRQTMRHIHAAGLNGHVLPVWQDIDTYEDLVAFYHRSKANRQPHLKTMIFLDQLNLKGLQ